VEVVALLSEGRTAAVQCGLFTHKSVPVIFEPPCNSIEAYLKKEAFSRKIPVIRHRQPYIPIYYIKFLKQSNLCLLISLHTKYRDGNRLSSLFFLHKNSSCAPCHTFRLTSSILIEVA